MPLEKFSDDHVPLSTEVFLDTSIHCCRLKGPGYTNRIADLLRLFTWKGTSSYSKVEFGNVILSEAEYFLRKLDELKSLDAVLDHVGHSLRDQSHSNKRTWAFSLLAKTYGANAAERTERAVLSLKRLLKTGTDFVEKSVDAPICDGTKCYWAKMGVQKRSDGTLYWKKPICVKTLKRCRIDEFFTDNVDLFKKIADAIEQIPATERSTQLSDFVVTIRAAAVDPSVLLDYKTGCRKIADAIIAVDSATYKNMFSQNERESDVLTKVLEQIFYYLPPNQERGIEIKST